jgi:hypothetical protein
LLEIQTMLRETFKRELGSSAGCERVLAEVHDLLATTAETKRDAAKRKRAKTVAAKKRIRESNAELAGVCAERRADYVRVHRECGWDLYFATFTGSAIGAGTTFKRVWDESEAGAP